MLTILIEDVFYPVCSYIPSDVSVSLECLLVGLSIYTKP